MHKINKKYIPSSLTKSDLLKQIKSIKMKSKRPKLDSFKSRQSNWVKKFKKKYGVPITDLEFIDNYILKKKGSDAILLKGRGAYYSSGSRPNQTEHSWAYARLASVILGGPARNIDNSIWEKYKISGKNNYDNIIEQFTPNLKPRQIFKMGSFGGTYWRPIKSSITNKEYRDIHKNYPASWWKNISKDKLVTPFNNYDKSINKYKVKVGTTLSFWEEKKWITKWHPYGWVQWYCDWMQGKRCPDDIRQIKRWLGVAGKKGRFRKRLLNMIKEKGGKKHVKDFTISPSIRQTLQHWGYKVNILDYEEEFE